MGLSETLILQVLAFLLAAIVAPPIFKKIGLGAVVGYLVAGVVIGPYGAAIFNDVASVQNLAQLGIVLLLFVIGLDTRLGRLYAMRGDILGLGLAQIGLTTIMLSFPLYLLGLAPLAALMVGFSLALSGTAVALQLMENRAALNKPWGQKSFAVLLTQDVVTVPVLAIVPVLLLSEANSGLTGNGFLDGLIALLVVATIVFAGRFLVNPLFRILASTGAREVMTAAALLVVLGAAGGAGLVGLSMPLGAFIAGVMLAGSSYRHQVLADVEPFRGLLLALFFMSVGMLIPLFDLVDAPLFIFSLLVLYLGVKALAGWVLATLFRIKGKDGLRFALTLLAAGEFSFVLIPLLVAGDLITPALSGQIIAIAALSMLLTPALLILAERLYDRFAKVADEMPLDDFPEEKGSVLIVGFGRFGQIAAQVLLADDAKITLIDANAQRVQDAARFGFKVYYGDGTRLDILQAAGAGEATVIFVCVDKPEDSIRICEMVRANFPLAKIYARAFDRVHAIDLINAGVDYQIRETAESAILAGAAVLRALGVDEEHVVRVERDVRKRDAERFKLQLSNGRFAGTDLLHQRTVRPEPLSAPRHKGEIVGDVPQPEEASG